VAQTVPLAEEGRATNGLPAEESQRLGEGTSRLKRTEVDDLLRRVAREHGTGDGQTNPAPPAQLDRQGQPQPPSAPFTAALQTPTADEGSDATATSAAATASSSSSSAPTAAAKVAKRARPARWRWQWAAIILLCASVTVALLAFLSSRNANTSDASAPAPVPGSEEKPQEATTETGALSIEPVTIESPPPLNTPSPPTRTREGEAAAHPAAPEAPATRTASPAPPLPSPPGGQTAATAPPSTTAAAPALSATDHYQRGVQLWERDRRSALEEFRAAVPGVADAYYYLGSEYYSEGRDPKSLNDGELRAALNYFLRATGGPHSGQAKVYAQQLGKEYERRKKQSRR
jgi:hypothetical protein